MNLVEYELNKWFHSKKVNPDVMDIMTLGYVSKANEPTYFDIFNIHY